jgi:GNAT superfamily N-acetyltransferase
MIDDRELFRRVRRLLLAEIELFGSSADGARVTRDGGVLASINAKAPDRSLFNWVAAESSEALMARYDEIARAYRDAGVRAWGVWVDPEDTSTEGELARRGHALDGRPRAMATSIGDMVDAPAGELDWEETDDVALVSRINDAAYGFPPPAFGAAMTRKSDPAWRAYVARQRGEPVTCVMSHESADGDCGISAVATLPVARGGGLASRLLMVAVRAAEARGALTTTLQASSKGAPIYARLGHRDLGAMSIWEHRVPPPAGG